jgi:hypothetical protein
VKLHKYHELTSDLSLSWFLYFSLVHFYSASIFHLSLSLSPFLYVLVYLFSTRAHANERQITLDFYGLLGGTKLLQRSVSYYSRCRVLSRTKIVADGRKKSSHMLLDISRIKSLRPCGCIFYVIILSRCLILQQPNRIRHSVLLNARAISF